MKTEPIVGTPKSNQHKEQQVKKAIKNFVKRIKTMPQWIKVR